MRFDFKNIIEFLDYFDNEETCLKIFEKVRFKDAYYCPHCNHNQIYKYSNGKLFKCKECKQQFTIKVVQYLKIQKYL